MTEYFSPQEQGKNTAGGAQETQKPVVVHVQSPLSSSVLQIIQWILLGVFMTCTVLWIMHVPFPGTNSSSTAHQPGQTGIWPHSDNIMHEQRRYNGHQMKNSMLSPLGSSSSRKTTSNPSSPAANDPGRNADWTSASVDINGDRHDVAAGIAPEGLSYGGFNPQMLQFGAKEHAFVVIADLDINSKKEQAHLWHSFLGQGILQYRTNGTYSVEIKNFTELQASTARNGRSMELSELLRYRHLLLAFCDYTGLVWKIRMEDGRVFQRYAIADGDGNQPNPFKIEWATVKDGMVWVGSVGKPWVDSETGDFVHRNAEWVKTIDENGRIENYDWGYVYAALKTAANVTGDGYLWHEAVHWDPLTKTWVFLPRQRSLTTKYNEHINERMGTNICLVSNEDFTNIRVFHIGPVEPEYGFASVRKVPGTKDIYMALKVKESLGETSTKLTVFDLNGHILLDGNGVENGFMHLSGYKFEGLEFL